MLVVTAHNARFLAYLRSRGLRYGQNVRRVTHPDQLLGISDAEIVFLGDWLKLPLGDEIEMHAHTAEILSSVTVTHADA